MNDFKTYQSPFSWRYGSKEMREIFSDENKFLTWRKIWVSLAKAQYEAGLITKQELNDLEKNQKNLDIERILEIEKETNHDVVSAIREFAEKAKIGGKKIHLKREISSGDQNIWRKNRKILRTFMYGLYPPSACRTNNFRIQVCFLCPGSFDRFRFLGLHLQNNQR